jgi:hypothetical protein
MPIDRQELLARVCPIGGGTRVQNCVLHENRSLLERPRDCFLCTADIVNRLRLSLGINGWLNEWKDDAIALLKTEK